MKALGAFSVKSYMQPRREARQWIIKAAREEGMLVVPEGGGDLEMDMTFVLDGHTTVEHALPITPLRKDVVDVLRAAAEPRTRRRCSSPTAASRATSGSTSTTRCGRTTRLQKFVPQRIVDTLGRIRGIMATDPADWHHIDVAASAKDVMHAGGRVCLGGHGQMQGLGPHWEMWAFVQGGMTPLEAIRVATRYPAETLGLDRDLGSIENGKLADFVVLDANPLEKIENSETVSLVVKNGRAYRPDDLQLSTSLTARGTSGKRSPTTPTSASDLNGFATKRGVPSSERRRSSVEKWPETNTVRFQSSRSMNFSLEWSRSPGRSGMYRSRTSAS